MLIILSFPTDGLARGLLRRQVRRTSWTPGVSSGFQVSRDTISDSGILGEAPQYNLVNQKISQIFVSIILKPFLRRGSVSSLTRKHVEQENAQ